MTAEKKKAEQKRDAIERVKTVQDILRRWDPINVRPGDLAPADEYDGYAGHIVSMVAQGCSVEQLRNHLERICVKSMGVEPNPGRDQEIASEILTALSRG